MKRFAAIMLSLALALAFSTASANSWGAKGKLVQELSAVKTWDDYTGVTEQAGDWMVLGGRYHNVLMFAGEDGLHLYHTAVWQPEDHRTMRLSLRNGELTLTAGAESFTFGECNDEMVLIRADLGGVTVRGNFSESEPPYGDFFGYELSDGRETVMLSCWKTALSDFNIRLFPRTPEEARRINELRAHLESGENILNTSWAEVIPGGGKETLPVYSAPFGEKAWRAAKGKAAMSLKDDYILYKGWTNGEGETYTCVSYAVSERTRRIGWVENSGLGSRALMPLNAVGESFIHVPVKTSRATFLTDDPFCSMFAQFDAPAGTPFECLGLAGGDWAYVSARVNGSGQFADQGSVVWGFVPLRDLEIDTETAGIQVDPSAMETLTGSWVYEAGGSMGPDALILYEDGRFESANVQYGPNGDETGLAPYTGGTWQVTNYDPAWGLYWNETPYEITLIYDNGTVNVKGLILEEDGFGLINNEGGGGYVRKELELTEDADHG